MKKSVFSSLFSRPVLLMISVLAQKGCIFISFPKKHHSSPKCNMEVVGGEKNLPIFSSSLPYSKSKQMSSFYIVAHTFLFAVPLVAVIKSKSCILHFISFSSSFFSFFLPQKKMRQKSNALSLLVTQGCCAVCNIKNAHPKRKLMLCCCSARYHCNNMPTLAATAFGRAFIHATILALLSHFEPSTV